MCVGSRCTPISNLDILKVFLVFRFRLIELYSFVILAYQQQPFIQAYIRFVALILMFLVQLSNSLILNSTQKILATADGIKNFHAN